MKLTKAECSAIISAALWKPVMVVTQTEAEYKAIKEQLTAYIKMNDRLWSIFDRKPSRYDIFLNGFYAIKIIDRASLQGYSTFSGLIFTYGLGDTLIFRDKYSRQNEVWELNEWVNHNREVFR